MIASLVDQCATMLGYGQSDEQEAQCLLPDGHKGPHEAITDGGQFLRQTNTPFPRSPFNPLHRLSLYEAMAHARKLPQCDILGLLLFWGSHTRLNYNTLLKEVEAMTKVMETLKIDLTQQIVDLTAAYSGMAGVAEDRVMNIRAALPVDAAPSIWEDLRAISDVLLTIKKAEMDVRAGQAQAQPDPAIEQPEATDEADAPGTVDATTTADTQAAFLPSSF